MTAQRVLFGIAVVVVSLLLFGRKTPAAERPLPAVAVTTMNWLRGLAAVAVLVGHVRGLFMQDYEALESKSAAWKAFYLLSGLGHQAVIVFFVLSGFLVGASVLARQQVNGRWDFRDYFTRRLVRLYVVLIPGLLLTAAWDAAGLRLFGAEGLYGGALDARHLTMPDVRVTLSLEHFLGNLAFLQHIFIAPFGTNGPLWSLSYEFWAYLLFPLLVRAGGTAEKPVTRAVYGLLATLIIVGGGLKLAFYFSIWLVGAGLALWWLRTAWRPARPITIAALACLFAGALVVGRSSRLSDSVADVILAATTAALLAAVLTLPDRMPKRALSRANASGADWLAGFSYTLYVAHYPVLAFLFVATMGGVRWAASAQAVLAVLAISLGVLLLYAFPLSRLTEAHTDSLRRRLSRPRPKVGQAAA
ncbi:MAG TPA: acyltransferase [Polyangiaceae bacterium]|nr:acyltransferase [Polyangiaceae bacterium]